MVVVACAGNRDGSCGVCGELCGLLNDRNRFFVALDRGREPDERRERGRW